MSAKKEKKKKREKEKDIDVLVSMFDDEPSLSVFLSLASLSFSNV